MKINEFIRLLLPRVLVTLGILMLVRSGTFLPVPGIHNADLDFYLERTPVVKNLISTFSGDKKFFIGLFSLNIFPYINASILVQILIGFSPKFANLRNEGDFAGKRRISRITRNITLVIAILQSIGLVLYLRSVLFNWTFSLAIEVILWLTTGAMIVLWLSELITDYGLGNGTSLLVYINIISNLPNLLKKLLIENSGTSAFLSMTSILGISLVVFASLCGIVVLQNSIVRIPLISSRQLNQSSFQDRSRTRTRSYLPLRFNQAGVMPIILTTSFLVIPNYLINLGFFKWLSFLTSLKFIYWIGYFFLILAFSSFYSSLVLNPKDISDQLQKMAVKIPGVRPGVQTTFYLKQEMKRVTLVGATLLAIITIIPNFIESMLDITGLNALTTTSFLILAGVILDLKREISEIYLSNIYNSMYR